MNTANTQIVSELTGDEPALGGDMVDALTGLEPGLTGAALGRWLPQADRQHYLDLLRSHDSSLRWQSIEALEAAGPEGVPGLVVGPLRDRNPRFRARAAMALGQSRDRRALSGLVVALGDRTSEVRYFAALALGKLGDSHAAPALVGTLRDRAWQVRSAATLAIQMIGPAALPVLLAMLRDPGAEDALRRDVLRALEPLASARVTADVQRYLHERHSPEVRSAAARTLGFTQDPAAIGPLVGALQVAERTVCQAAVRALGMLDQPQAVPHLFALLPDAPSDLQRLAARAIVQFGEAALPYLAQAGTNGDARHRWWANNLTERIAQGASQPPRPTLRRPVRR